ncbi:hypothetical protein PGTUg99_029374 [Puccinia graminis f. sp. tritici]|uniref:Uncharacterized protein n=1 Tax=Puccinia graminis f. sp. tritici TaxID=56615 RepID=A0A5B0SQG0_PUCGR|nr:hypothetical protein PGTUg99_029374 [Puccinia graminis f. sp. tritici]
MKYPLLQNPAVTLGTIISGRPSLGPCPQKQANICEYSDHVKEVNFQPAHADSGSVTNIPSIKTEAFLLDERNAVNHQRLGSDCDHGEDLRSLRGTHRPACNLNLDLSLRSGFEPISSTQTKRGDIDFMGLLTQEPNIHLEQHNQSRSSDGMYYQPQEISASNVKGTGSDPKPELDLALGLYSDTLYPKNKRQKIADPSSPNLQSGKISENENDKKHG